MVVVVKMCTPQTLLLLLFHLALSLTVSSQWPIDDDGCRTPNRGVGKCVLITECPIILNFILKSSRLTPKDVKILKYYRCGVYKNTIKMCCPKNNIIETKFKGDEDDEREVTVSVYPLPLDVPQVYYHKNFHLLPTDCGTAETQNKIFFGKKATLYEFPWMALLSYQTRSDNIFRCGGTIINERYILTAAHCISNQPSLVAIRAGEYNVRTKRDCELADDGTLSCSPPVQDVRIEEAIIHPNFSISSLLNDIGLLRLSTPLNLSLENAKPICLPTSASLMNLDLLNKTMMVTGWGVTESGVNSDVLLKAAAPVVSRETCGAIYKNQSIPITTRQLCTGGVNSSDSCYGDSGGPVQSAQYMNEDVRFVQFGVVSVGPRSCGYKEYPSINTRVDSYVNWILDTIKP